MLFLDLILAGPAIIDIESSKAEISPLNEFGPTMQGLIRGLFFGAAVLTFFYMLWGALDWIMSSGDSSKVEAARKKITNALLGLAVLASVGAIFMLVQRFLGFDILVN